MFKKCPLQTIQFSISTKFYSIWPIDRDFSGLPLRARVDMGVMAMKAYSAFSKAPVLQDPYHQII